MAKAEVTMTVNSFSVSVAIVYPCYDDNSLIVLNQTVRSEVPTVICTYSLLGLSSQAASSYLLPLLFLHHLGLLFTVPCPYPLFLSPFLFPPLGVIS